MNNVRVEKNNLPKKEVILGQLLSRISGDELKMHSSDFSVLIESLDMTSSDVSVEEILVNCQIDSSGWIDFSRIPSLLERERATNMEQKSPKKGKVSSVGAPTRPWRPTESHTEQIQSEEQFKNVMANRQVIQDLISAYNEHRMPRDVFLRNIESASITLTPAFATLMQTRTNSNILFADVVKSLTARSSTKQVEDVAAGGKSNLVNGVSSSQEEAALFPSRRRIEWASNKNYSKSNDIVHSKPVGPHTPMHAGTISSVMRFDEDSYPTTETRESAMNSTGQIWDSAMNSEQRLIREQVLAALRQLCNGEMSISAFMQRSHDMGITIPPSIERLLTNFEVTGCIDFKEAMRDFEKFFENRRVEGKIDPEKVSEIKNRVREGFISRGASSIQGVRDLFNQLDTDGSGGLSYAEFADALSNMETGLAQDEVRALFNDFDSNGNGLISCDEFLVGIRGVLSGHRLRTVKSLLKHFDVIGENKALMSDLETKFDPNVHPDVISGSKSVREVCSDFSKATALTFEEDSEMVNLSSLEEYFANLSTAIDSDEEFDGIIFNMFDIEIHSPPPRAKSHFMRNGVIRASHTASQDHGDLLGWSEGQSAVDAVEQSEENKMSFNKSKKDAQRMSTFNFNGWDSKSEGEDLLKQQLSEQVCGFGSVRGTRKIFSTPSENILEWKQPSKSNEDKSGRVVSLSQMMQTSPVKKKSNVVSLSEVYHEREVESAKQQITTSARQRTFQKSCPFGKDDYSNPNLAAQEPSRSNPKSLKDFLGK